jgi:RNA polymerase sigma-70 factor (ECF subfamily)
MSAEDSFEQTLRAAQGGDGRAFGILYESLDRRVLTFVSLRGAADPEGTVSDVFVKVFTNLGSFSGNETQFSAWVFTIARNTLIDEARRRRRRVEESELDTDAADGLVTGDVEADVMARLGDEWMREQLEVLTPDQRDVVVLRIAGDLSLEAVAEVLGKRVGAVKAMQRRAFRTLAKKLGAEPYPDDRVRRS